MKALYSIFDLYMYICARIIIISLSAHCNNYIANMNQEQARELYEEGAFIVLLEVPQNTEIGIDYNSWRSGPKFMGIKMIPPGLHFVYYR